MSTTTTYTGVRIVDMPDLGAVTDTSSMVGERAGSGRFNAAALRSYTNGPASPTGQFFQNDGAIIHRMNDRLLLGAATVNDACMPNTTQDWAEVAIPGDSCTSKAQFASLSTIGAVAGFFASQAADASADTLTAIDCIALMALGINNPPSHSATAGLAAYFEMQHLNPNGYSTAVEIDIVNQSGVVTKINPYQLVATFQSNLHLGSGGDRPGVVDSSAAITVMSNGAKFDKGIVFINAAIAAGGEIIATPKDTLIQWWGDGAHPTFFLQGSGSTAPFGIVQDDNAIYIGNSPSFGASAVASLSVRHCANAINYVAVDGGIAGQGPYISADGGDTDLDLAVLPKGAGMLHLGGPQTTTATAGAATALPAAPVYYLTVVLRNTNTVVKIPCYLP